MWLAVYTTFIILILSTSSNFKADAVKPPKPSYKPTTQVHKVPPEPKDWEQLAISREVKRFWELEWSKSTFSKECSEHVLQVVPVYFWPGERVDLPCHICELSMAYNGKVKYWAKAEEMEEFLTEPQINVISRKDLYHIVKNKEFLGGKLSPFNMVYIQGYPSGLTLPHPTFVQRNGKLSIIHANPTSQGVYFCYDDQSIAITNMFYVVQAMTPPVSIFDSEHIPESQQHLYDDYCSTTSGAVQISPAFNWRFHFQPTFRDDQHCAETNCSDSKRASASISKLTNMTCSLDGCRINIRPIYMPNSIFDPGLDIELRWDDWTSCDGNVPAQRREAHCYIVARPGFTVDEDAEDIASGIEQFQWAVKLGRLVRSDALRKTGVRLHSSTVASYLYRQTVLQGCGTVQEGIRIAAEDIWRKYLLLSMGVREHETWKHIDRKSDLHLRLNNAFRACLRYEKAGENHEMIIGTYMVETRDCF